MIRTSLLDDIAKCGNWFVSTFTARDAAPFRADIPGFLAKWLFRIGTIGAAIQVPISCFVLIYTFVFLIGGLIYGKPFGPAKEMVIVPYVLVSYAVWIGWGWRSRKPRNMAMSMMFWLVSAAFNAILPAQALMESESFAEFFHGLWSPFSPGLLWFIALSGVSLLAFFFEIFQPRLEKAKC